MGMDQFLISGTVFIFIAKLAHLEQNWPIFEVCQDHKIFI